MYTLYSVVNETIIVHIYYIIHTTVSLQWGKKLTHIVFSNMPRCMVQCQDFALIKFTENSFIYESLTLTFLLTFHPHCISIQILILHFKSSSSNPLGPLLASALYRQTILISHRGVTFHLLINFLYGTVSQDIDLYFFMILTHLAPLFICQSIFVDFTETYSMCCL